MPTKGKIIAGSNQVNASPFFAKDAKHGHPASSLLSDSPRLDPAQNLVFPNDIGFLRRGVPFSQDTCRITKRHSIRFWRHFPERPLTLGIIETGVSQQVLLPSHRLRRSMCRMTRNLKHLWLTV